MIKDKTQKAIDDLLRLLDTPEVQQRIASIVTDVVKKGSTEGMQIKHDCLPEDLSVPARSGSTTSVGNISAPSPDSRRPSQEGDSSELDNNTKEKLGELQGKYDQLNGKLTQAENANIELQGKNDELNGKLTQAENANIELQGKNDELNGKLTQAENTNIELQGKNDELNGKLTQAENANIELQGKNDELNGKLTQAEKTIRELEKHKNTLQGNIQGLEDKISVLEQDISDAASELNTLRELIQPIQDIYTEYQKLPNSIKQNLAAVFTGNNMWSFFFCGLREEALKAMWNQWKHLLDQHKKPDESLKKMFYFFFDRLNSIYEVPEYTLVEPENGSIFNSAIAISDSSGNTQGKVEQVIIPGLSYAKSGMIITKPIVLVK